MSAPPSNPFESPSGNTDWSESLSKRQRKTLEFYQANRDRQLSILSIAMGNAPFWLGLIAITVLVFFLARLPQGPGPNAAWVLALLFGIFAAGAVVRDFGYARRISKTWPITSQVLDWDKIEKLLKQT